MDAVVITNSREPFLDPNFWYVTGAMGGLFESSLAVVRRGGVQAIVSAMEEHSAREGAASVRVYKDAKERDELTLDTLRDVERVGMNYSGTSHAEAVRLNELLSDREFVDVGAGLSRCRSIKDGQEVKAIKRACDIASQVADEMPELIERGMTEQRLAGRIDSLLRERGSEGVPFETIVAFGDNAAHPHHRPGGRVLKEGMVILCDFGATHLRYCSDLTRTVFCGQPEARAARAYEAVAEAQQKGIEAMSAGVKADVPDAVARKVIETAGFEGLFIHSFGHELGLAVHEGGVMGPRSQHELLSGMVMSAEPGVYIPGRFGIRMEDTIHIGPEGAERLTHFDRSLTVV